jgi:DnaJ family protein A protein 2
MSAHHDLYSILGVSRNADDGEIRKSYRKLCLTAHPDKGGSAEEFQKIQHAYEILSDGQKRQMYDQTGSTDEQQIPGGVNVDLGSMFANMFGGGFNPFDQMPGMPNRTKRHKPHPKIHEIPVSLYDFYHGKQLKIQFERQKFCVGCKGEGFSNFSNCDRCHGRGIIEQMMMVGPGMMATSRGPCDHCGGKGKKGTTKCSTCSSKKTFTQEKILDINIESGMKKGDSHIFSNECSDDINYQEPGDVHIFFQEADELVDVSRSGDDLHGMCNISFKESILGTSYTIKHHPKYPNGFEIKIPMGTMNGETVTVLNEGMPKRYSKQFGNFVLKVDVIISEDEKKILETHHAEFEKLFSAEG